eukprot:6480838-Amphidinium_carterae.1
MVAKRLAGDASVEEQRVESHDGPAADTDGSASSESSAEQSDVDLCDSMWKEGDHSPCNEGDYVVNPKSGCMHIAAGSDVTHCGIMTLGLDAFEEYHAAFTASGSMCKKCFKALR